MGKHIDRVSLTIPNDVKYVPVVLDSTAAFARLLDFEGKKIKEIMLGVEEAVVNVIDHAFIPGEKATFDIVFQRVPLGLQVVIKEKGIPFDPLELAGFSKDKPFTEEDTRGLGLYLLYRFMDEVSFINLGKEGKETRLLKYLQTLVPEEFDSLKPAAAEAAGTVPPYSIRRMLPHEAVEVSRCAYLAYGRSYCNEHVYFPERLRELNAEDRMISLVAVSESGEIMGHIAFVFAGDDPKVPEADDAFVKPEYRGSGCLNKLGQALNDWAMENGLTGYYSLAVTTHTYSQKVTYKWGLRDCAILLSGDSPFEFKGIKDGKGQRESEMIAFKYCKPLSDFKIFAPAQHHDIIARIYRQLGVDPEILRPDDGIGLPDEEAVIELKHDPSLIAFIIVSQYGRNVLAEVGQILKGLCVKRLETIFLYLPLEDPLTALLTGEFEKMGFFFSGVIPGSEGRNRLILQYLNNQILDYGQICVHSEMGREILDYIRSRDPNQG